MSDWDKDSKVQNAIDEKIADIEDELGVVIDYTWDYYEDPKETN